jgi:signal transduction histidine kinase/ActR/RegA family two-component response regulator
MSDIAADAEHAALKRELAALRAALRERDDTITQLELVREANSQLVVSALTAQAVRDEAHAVNRRQNEFLAMLAHELRNPLAPISTAAALLARLPETTPQLRRLQTVIGRQVDHMSRLLDDLLDAARISSGKIQLAIEPVDLAEVVAQAVETVQPRVLERSQTLSVSVPPQDVRFDADQVRLAQVLSNLLTNASKYSPDGATLGLDASVEEDMLVLRVSDNGAGIAPDLIAHVFDLFTQGPRTLARSEGGLGIGLNVVRNLVQMHGGQVEAYSPGPGQGSVFTVRLPLRRGAAAAPALAARKVAQALDVLLVEDNEDAARTLADLLQLEGHRVRIALDGHEGLAHAMAEPAAVLVCDLGLPGMDGYTLMRELRRQSAPGKPFAIALSGYGQPEDRIRALAAGFDRFCVKPVRIESLLALLAEAEDA